MPNIVDREIARAAKFNLLFIVQRGTCAAIMAPHTPISLHASVRAAKARVHKVANLYPHMRGGKFKRWETRDFPVAWRFRQAPA